LEHGLVIPELRINVNDLIRQISEISNLRIPKAANREDQIFNAFGSDYGETPQSWLVPCGHILNPPATREQIEIAEASLGFSIPESYKQFLEISDGAKLFGTPRKWPKETLEGEHHYRFHLFNCQELVESNDRLRQVFREVYAQDPEFRDHRQLNYLAFCYAEDGNYQALLLDEGHADRVFLLFHELFYRPYNELDADFYYTISESLEAWFCLLINSGGWEGRGELTSGL
jgi:hypothetical protein